VTTPATEQPRLRRQARIFVFLAGAAGSLAVLSVFVQVVTVAAPLWKGGPIEATLVKTLSELLLSAPALFYVAGLIRARRVFRRIGAGEIFVQANSDGLTTVGATLLIGALWAMIVAGLEPTVSLDPIVRDVAAGASQLALAALGLALLMIGRVMSAAVRLKTESDEFV
jgi:hypothetical protein